MSTEKAAEIMITTGNFYSAKALAQEFHVSERRASGWLNTMIKSERYETIQCKSDSNKVKVITIDGRKRTLNQIQHDVLLFRRPTMLTGGVTN